MGEKKQKSRHRSAILSAEQRCIYCDRVPDTVEHMPPVSMFQRRLRLSGLEFASCEECNVGTRAADIVAAFMSRLFVTNDVTDWRVEEAYKLIGGLAALAPEVIREIFGKRGELTWIRNRGGVLEPARKMQADGPALKALMTVFAAKLGMALFRERCGKPLPMEGGVFTQFYFNAGLPDDVAMTILSIMPARNSLMQGRSHSVEQFAYRYNTDGRSIVAALAGFHSSLHFRPFAIADPERYQFLLGEYNTDFVRPGELAARVSAALRSAKLALAGPSLDDTKQVTGED